MQRLDQLGFDNSFARLPADFFSRVAPTPLAGATRPAAASPAARALIDLDPAEASRPEFFAVFGGQKLLAGMEPVAALYAGQQFAQYVPQLGDGRAILLGETVSARGERWELQLNGAALTPSSRQGDGRAVLRSGIRVFLCSEHMHALGIPTTRVLCLVHGDEEVYRERIETGASLTRLAPSHPRSGSFEVLFHRGRFGLSQRLGHDLIECHYSELVDSPTPWLDLLRAVLRRSARLIAQWQLVGFAHAVMSSDNMSMLGLTIDYGPFGFLDACDPKLIGNHSDHWGRYAFERQPAIAKWNLSCLAQAMLPLLDPEDGEHAAEAQDYGELNRLLAVLVLSRPYDEQPEHAAYAAGPLDWGRRLAVSCSS